MKFHISRWRFWWAYFIVILLAMLAIWLNDRGYDRSVWISAVFALILFVILEFMIRLERVDITDAQIELRRGIFSKDVTRVMYHSISDVTARQTFLQRILRFGDVEIDTPGSPKAEIVLTGFEEAAKIDAIISGHIHRVHEAHEHHATGPHVGP